jgi:hypothetical protein
VFERFRDRFCLVHRAPAFERWAIHEKSFAYVEHFTVPVNDDLNLSFEYL